MLLNVWANFFYVFNHANTFLVLAVLTHRSHGPVDIEHFRSLMVENSNCCEKAEDKLMSSWFNQVMTFFLGQQQSHCRLETPTKPNEQVLVYINTHHKPGQCYVAIFIMLQK